MTIWTLRAENYWQAPSMWIGTDPKDFGMAIDEAKAYFKAKVDGVFCDQPDVCVEARNQFLAGT